MHFMTSAYCSEVLHTGRLQKEEKETFCSDIRSLILQYVPGFLMCKFKWHIYAGLHLMFNKVLFKFLIVLSWSCTRKCVSCLGVRALCKSSVILLFLTPRSSL